MLRGARGPFLQRGHVGLRRPGISSPANLPTMLQGDVAVVGRLQELPTKAPLSMEASWRAVVVGAVLPMAVVDAAAGMPPRGLWWQRCGVPGVVGVAWRCGGYVAC